MSARSNTCSRVRKPAADTATREPKPGEGGSICAATTWLLSPSRTTGLAVVEGEGSGAVGSLGRAESVQPASARANPKTAADRRRVAAPVQVAIIEANDTASGNLSAVTAKRLAA